MPPAAMRRKVATLAAMDNHNRRRAFVRGVGALAAKSGIGGLYQYRLVIKTNTARSAAGRAKM
jgi:hypothetical protein